MGMDYRNFLKKIFRKGNPIPSSGVLGGWYTHTPLHHDDNIRMLPDAPWPFLLSFVVCLKNTVICVFKVLFTAL